MATKKVAVKTKHAPIKKKTARKTPPAVKHAGSADICFVIMPFGGWLDSYYSSIYQPAIEAAGLEPHRADDLFRPSTIVNDIWAYTKKAKVLLADLTGKNPNVFYELGLAHALAKPVILIAESMDDIPFDLRALRIILYDKNAPHWGQLLGEKIEASLSEVLASPVEAVLPAFLEVRESNKPSISQEQKDLIELKQEMDLIRRSVATRESNYAPDNPRPRGPDSARELIKEYLLRGMPISMIAERVSREVGSPRSWTEREVAAQIARRASRTAPVASELTDTATVPPASQQRVLAQQAAMEVAAKALEKVEREAPGQSTEQSAVNPRPKYKPARAKSLPKPR